MRKYIPIPISAIMDPELTDAEKNLLFKMIANFGTAIIKPNEPFLTTLKISRRTFYRLMDNLLKHQYIQRSEDGLGFKIAVTILAQNSARYDTDSAKVGTEECQSWHTENEEKERTKEKEDKEYKQQDSVVNNNINKGVTENDKEREIQKREKAGESGDAGKPEKAVRKSKPFVKPTVEEVLAYCRERKSTVSAQAFVDFYESKGWMVGKNHMKDWKAAVRTWEQKDKANGRYFVPAENQSTPDDDYPF